MELDEIDLTDLAVFADGFPHPTFAHLRREAPVLWHEPTVHTPDGVGFWVLSRHAELMAAGRTPRLSLPNGRRAAPAGGRSSRTCPTASPPGCC